MANPFQQLDALESSVAQSPASLGKIQAQLKATAEQSLRSIAAPWDRVATSTSGELAKIDAAARKLESDLTAALSKLESDVSRRAGARAGDLKAQAGALRKEFSAAVGGARDASTFAIGAV